MEEKRYSFIDLFAGIGGFRLALERAGCNCVFSCEWNKYAQITYRENFGELPYGDITKINEYNIADHDILTGGFPCQPFSIAGVSKKNSLGRKHGFDDEKQGNLFFDITRIINAKQPKAFILENVKNLKSHDKGKTYNIIINTLKALNYRIFDKVIDAADYLPQHRERIFIVGFRSDICKNNYFSFPLPPVQRKIQLRDILDEKEPDKKYTLSDHLWNYLQKYAEKHKANGNGFGYGLINPVISINTRTLSARYYKDGSEILVIQNGRNPRRLTPRECARFQGFPDSYKLPKDFPDTKLYKQFGNSVSVPVIERVATNIKKALT